MKGLTRQFDAFTAAGNALVLAVTSSPVEVGLLEEWLVEQRRTSPKADIAVLHLPAGDPQPNVVSRLLAELEADDARQVVPVRVFWMPRASASNRSKLTAWLAGRDPYRPSQRRQRRIAESDPSRVRVVSGEPATVADLRSQWQSTTAAHDRRDFARFVVRRAVLAIERVEYRLLGPEFKSPRLVKPEILASKRFQQGLEHIPGATVDEAGRLLDEMATGWSRLSIDLLPAFFRKVIERGFDPQLDIDAGEIDAMRTALERHPAVLLFSHRSNLDGAVLAVALKENRLPRAHVFGGINMAFSFMGPLLRRSGIIFIRRDVGDDPLYKYVLKEYVGYVAEKRFPLSWSIEGTRSRTGKMLPPKLGLLSYVADAYRDRRSDDVLLQPVSISFDQLHEVGEYAEYARGGTKKREGVRWLYRIIKAQGERNYGRIYVRFPEPVSMRQYLGKPDGLIDTDEASTRLALQKMAIEVAWRTQSATPVNAAALVSALLLATRGIALTLSQIHHTLADGLEYLERSQTPMTASARLLTTPEGVRSALDALDGGHPVSRVDDGWETVWHIESQNEHAAAFYRNSVIHAFLETSIVELALAHAARAPGNRLDAFWAQAFRLRDLLKFDFYFAGSTEFREHMASEMAWRSGWETEISRASLLSLSFDGINAMLYAKRPLMSYAMLRPFIEAYEILAGVLCKSPATLSEEDLTRVSLGVGRQYVAQGRVLSSEPVSALLFATARKVAVDQRLLDPSPDLHVRRLAFHAELRSILSDIDFVEQLARKQFKAREIAARQPGKKA